MSTLYASFVNSSAAERAAGALLDHGARSEDLTIIANDSRATRSAAADAVDAEKSAKGGISTTTPGDVAMGAVKGTAVGVGVGVLAALTSLLIPGIGLVIGGGALATAMAGAAATAVAGAAAGGVAGYLKDQGVPEEMVTKYSDAFYSGGSIIALAVPSGDLAAEEAEGVLAKYGAVNIATYNAPRALVDSVPDVSRPPMVVESANPDIEPVVIVDRPGAAVVEPASTVVHHQVIDSTTGERTTSTVETRPRAVIEETVVSGPTQVVIDPVTGAEAVVPVSSPTTLPPNNETVVDPVMGTVHQTVGHPTVINETPIEVVDPVSGVARPGAIVEEQRAVVAKPTVVDASGQVIEAPETMHDTVVMREQKLVVDEDTHRKG